MCRQFISLFEGVYDDAWKKLKDEPLKYAQQATGQTGWKQIRWESIRPGRHILFIRTGMDDDAPQGYEAEVINKIHEPGESDRFLVLMKDSKRQRILANASLFTCRPKKKSEKPS